MLYEWEGWSLVVEELHILWTRIRILNLLSSVILIFLFFKEWLRWSEVMRLIYYTQYFLF